MEVSRIVLFLVLLLFPAAVACSAASGANMVVLNKSDNGKEITIPEGGVVELNLEMKAGTGYSWEVIGLDKTRLELVDKSTKSLKEGPIAGGPVLKTWRFKAVGTGRTELQLYYYRVWEGLEKAVDKFQVRIRIG